MLPLLGVDVTLGVRDQVVWTFDRKLGTDREVALVPVLLIQKLSHSVILVVRIPDELDDAVLCDLGGNG